MKKLFSAILFVAITFSTIHAQVKSTIKPGIKPTIQMNTALSKNVANTKGLKLAANKKLTAGDFKKLNIPRVQISVEQLNAESIRTWKINPMKMKDGFFQLDKFKGEMTTRDWSFGGYRTSFLAQKVERFNGGIEAQNSAPLKIKFRATGGIEYRLKFENLYGRADDYIFVVKKTRNNTTVSKLFPTDQNEYLYVFKESSSCDVQISFSAVPDFDTRSEEEIRRAREYERRRGHDARRGGHDFIRRDYWGWVKIPEIRIDRIN